LHLRFEFAPKLTQVKSPRQFNPTIMEILFKGILPIWLKIPEKQDLLGKKSPSGKYFFILPA
jgi:hypothetical protein